MLYFSETARNFFMILSLGQYFLSHELEPIGRAIYDILLDDIFHRYFHNTFKVDNISFHEPSQPIGRAGLSASEDYLAFIETKREENNWPRLIGRNLVISLYDILLDDIFLENGSKFFHNTFPALSWQYFLSFEPSQPIGRASLYDWRSWKHR